MRLPTLLLAVAACSGTISGGGDRAKRSDARVVEDAHSVVDAPSRPAIKVLRGVDRASAFAMSEASTLHSSFGVQWTGVYIGGACNAGSGWTMSLVASMATQLGWTFMPIYVGQQTSSICGADTLTAAQGTSDGNDTAAAMQTFGWQPNKQIPVCLDLEADTYSADPTGATAYVKAWRDAVHSAGFLAYVYSNPTALNGMVSSGVTLDGVWPASWFYTGFADVAPADLDQLGSNYTNKDRAWQYAGSFDVQGAGTVDGDTSDLLLAPAPGGTNL
jgi:hypothetical protein